MSSGRRQLQTAWALAGFTALELLLGVMLTVMLAIGSAPLVLSTQQSGAREADRTVRLIQARVAVARLERDLRMATAGRCNFMVEGPVLEATPSQIVFLGRRVGVEELSIIEWEIVGSSLMRRWGPCPTEMPASFAHSIYVDNKTMLEGLGADASLMYVVGGAVSRETVSDTELCRISSVRLHSAGTDASGSWSPFLDSDSRVGL